MSPLRWMQFTGPHWTVMVEEVTADTLTKVGAADGAVSMETLQLDNMINNNVCHSPASRVIAVIGSLTTLLSAALLAVTVIL